MWIWQESYISRVKRLSYAEGFEDAVELCLHELKKAKDLHEIEDRLREIIELVKERKFDRIKNMLAL